MSTKEDSEKLIDRLIKRRKEENEAFIKLLLAMDKSKPVVNELAKVKRKNKS